MNLPELPVHLIFDKILPRLPAKSLTRFKTVCKGWLFTISNPDFVKSHLTWSSSHSQVLIHGDFWGSKPYFYLLPYGECGKRLEDLDKLDYTVTNGDNVAMVGSCNGLICLQVGEVDFCYSKQSFSIWNPATSERWEINSPERSIIRASGFGYVSSTDDYKIVAFVSHCSDVHYLAVHVYVYSLRAMKWKRIATLGKDYKRMQCEYLDSVMIDDTLYWGIIQGRGRWSEIKSIAAVNLITNQWEELPRMNWLSDYQWGHPIAVSGRLCMLCYGDKRSDVFDMWMLKQRHDWNSWEKSFTVNVRGKCLLYDSKTGQCTVGYNKRLKVFDPTKKTGEQCLQATIFPSKITKAMFYFESLISPSSIAKVNDDKHLTTPEHLRARPPDDFSVSTSTVFLSLGVFFSFCLFLVTLFLLPEILELLF